MHTLKLTLGHDCPTLGLVHHLESIVENTVEISKNYVYHCKLSSWSAKNLTQYRISYEAYLNYYWHQKSLLYLYLQ